MKKYILYFVIITIIFIGACSDSTEPSKTSTISGIVIDSLNQPIAGAKILTIFHFDPIPYWYKDFNNGLTSPDHLDPPGPTPPPTQATSIQNFPNPFSSTTCLWLFIREMNIFDLYILDHSLNTVKICFSNESLNMGHYAWALDGKNDADKFVENGIYTAGLTSDTIMVYTEIFLNKEYDSSTQIEDYECSIITDDEGKFKIPQTDFPFGDSLQYIDVQGCLRDTGSVTRYLKLWAFADGHNPVFLDSVYVDKKDGCDVILKLFE